MRKQFCRKNPSEEDLIVDLSLIPLKSTVFVSVYDPAKHPVEGAQILMNGDPVGSTSQYGRLSIPDLELRSYEIRVSKNGYKDVDQTVEITPNSSDVIFDLIPESTKVTVSVQDLQGKDLPNASVRVDNGSSILSDNNGSAFLNLKEGQSYLVSADLEGYLSNNTTIIPPVVSPVHLTLLQRERKEIEAPFPWLYLGVAIVIGVLGVLLVLFSRRGGRRPSSHSRKKQMVLRKRSL